MTKFNKLLRQLEKDFPAISFSVDQLFKWSPDNQCIYFNPKLPQAPLFLLHELAHCSLGHNTYRFDIELLKKEAEAWNYVKTKLCPRYQITFSDKLAQNTIDSYRDWLHKRSRCPYCQAVGSQIKANTYYCVDCHHNWQVNDAKFTQLKRYRQTK